LNSTIDHIIQKQSISISFENPANALGLQNRIAELFYERVQPQMEALFDELADADHNIKIETLEIDCGIIKGKHWEEEWVDTVLFRLKQELNALPKNKTQPGQVNNQFLFFLEAGHLSWNHSAKTIAQLEKEVIPDQFFFERLEEILRSSVSARKRLINQFSEKFLKRLVDAYLKDGHTTLEEYYATEYSVLFTTGNLKDTLREIFADDKPIESLAMKKVDDGIGNPIVEKKVKTKQSREVYVNNAGLVLLHPFLPRLFEELNLVIDNQWIDEESQEKAVLILEFLLTGKEEFPEFNLPLNKIICDVDLENALEQSLIVNDQIKLASEELLREVIRHWSVLKNTGIGSLRETFLQRNGKLTPVEKGWLLQVEQKGVDVLLGKLPWGIGIVKLPWMEEILYVEWV
jgi:hypothetical protein